MHWCKNWCSWLRCTNQSPLGLPLFAGFLGVDPRGLEPLTSAMRSQHNSLLEVSRGCKISANKHIIYLILLLRFQNIRLGCCTVAAHRARWQDSNLRPSTS